MEAAEAISILSVGAIDFRDEGTGTNKALITKSEMAGMMSGISPMRYWLIMFKYCTGRNEKTTHEETMASLYWRIAVDLLAESKGWSAKVDRGAIAEVTLKEYYNGKAFSNAERFDLMGKTQQKDKQLKRYKEALFEINLLEVEGLTIVSRNLGR